MAEQDRTRDIADNDLVLTSAEFAASIGWRLEPESPDGAVLSGGLGESPDDRDGDESDSFKAQHDAEVTPEIERARSAVVQLRVITDMVRGFWRPPPRDHADPATR